MVEIKLMLIPEKGADAYFMIRPCGNCETSTKTDVAI